MSTVCSSSDIVSFPRQTNIKNIKSAYYDKISVDSLSIDFTFVPRTTIPQFSDSSRQTGELNESPNSSSCKYNDQEYNLYNVQLCSSTHKNFLDDSTSDNRIDIVITYLKKNDESDVQPRFVILVLPLINDPSLLVNDLYLSGLGGEIQNTIFSLGNLFIKTNLFYYYTTCLEPNGDRAFVYVNKKGTLISQILYYKILAQWKLQPLSSLMSDISNDVNNIKQRAQNLLGSITQSTDITEIQSKLDSASALTQTINYISIVEAWPYYSPYPGIVLNVPSRAFTLDTLKKEGFQNNINNSKLGMIHTKSKFKFDTLLNEGFQNTDVTSSGVASGSVVATNNINSNNLISNINTSNSGLNLGAVKCVSLDLDGVMDASGNINFNADGSMSLSDLQKQRDKIRNEVPVVDFAKKNKSFNDAIIAFGSISIALMILIIGFAVFNRYNKGVISSSTLEQIHPASSSIWYYLAIGFIVGFCGYLIGVASTPTG